MFIIIVNHCLLEHWPINSLLSGFDPLRPNTFTKDRGSCTRLRTRTTGTQVSIHIIVTDEEISKELHILCTRSPREALFRYVLCDLITEDSARLRMCILFLLAVARLCVLMRCPQPHSHLLSQFCCSLSNGNRKQWSGPRSYSCCEEEREPTPDGMR